MVYHPEAKLIAWDGGKRRRADTQLSLVLSQPLRAKCGMPARSDHTKRLWLRATLCPGGAAINQRELRVGVSPFPTLR